MCGFMGMMGVGVSSAYWRPCLLVMQMGVTFDMGSGCVSAFPLYTSYHL